MCYRKVLRLDALAASRDKTVVSVIILHYSSCALAFILVQSTRAQNLERSEWDFFRLGWCGVLKRTIKHLLTVNLGILRTAVPSVDCIIVPFQYGDCFRFRDLFVIWLSNIAEYKPEPKKMSINSPKCSNFPPSRSSSCASLGFLMLLVLLDCSMKVTLWPCTVHGAVDLKLAWSTEISVSFKLLQLPDCQSEFHCVIVCQHTTHWKHTSTICGTSKEKSNNRTCKETVVRMHKEMTLKGKLV